MALSKYFGHNSIYIDPYTVASFVSKHVFYVIIGMNNTSQLSFISAYNNYRGLSIVGVFIAVVLNFRRFFQIL